jgi:hypothetical protein
MVKESFSAETVRKKLTYFICYKVEVLTINKNICILSPVYWLMTTDMDVVSYPFDKL